MRVAHQCVVPLNAVRHVGIDKQVPGQEALHFPGMITDRQLEQFQQVVDLVIAPVADVGPGVIRLQHLPVDAVPGNPIRVVAIRRRRVDELGDEALDKFRVGKGQGLPVLEDIAPVALEVQLVGPVRVPDVN